MKEFFRKTLALALAAMLTLSLAACGPKEQGEVPNDPSPSPSPTQTVDELDGMGVDFLPDNGTDVTQVTLGFPGDTELLTVNGRAVTAEEYLYWLANMTDYYAMMLLYSGSNFDLDAPITEDGVTWDVQLKEIAYQNAVLLAVAEEAAAKCGVALEDSDRESVIQQRSDRIESAGDKATYAGQLQERGIDDRTLFAMDLRATLLDKVQARYTEMALSDDSPEAITDQEMAEYLEENGILRAKHILLLTKDMDTGEAYDDAKKAEQKAKAEDILSQLRADPSKFDQLMNENSEDTGLTAYPDGYLFGPGEMVSEFENGTRALEVGAISDLIESSFGYHIILRLDGDCDEAREECATWKFNQMMNGFIDNATVVKAAEYDSFTTKDYYNALSEYRQSLQEPVTDDQSNATLEPQPTPVAEPAS